MRNRVAIFALLSFAVSALGQTSRPLTELLPPVPPGPVIIDLEGTWRGAGDSNTAGGFTFRRQGDLVIGFDALPSSPYFGKQSVSFHYSGEKTFVMKLEKGLADAGLKDLDGEISDPDTLLINKNPFYRISPPKFNDIPCDPHNQFHVTAAGAMARADVAAAAEKYPLVLCWAAVAATLGDAIGQFVVGAYLRNGIVYPKNPPSAFPWLLSSAKQGMVEAQYALAEIYLAGEGVPRDFKQYLYWFTQAQNNYYAQHRDEIWATALRAYSNKVDADDAAREEQARRQRFCSVPTPTGRRWVCFSKP